MEHKLLLWIVSFSLIFVQIAAANQLADISVANNITTGMGSQNVAITLKSIIGTVNVNVIVYCDSPAYAPDASRTITLPQINEETIVYFTVSGSSSRPTTANCRVRVYYYGQEDTKNFTVTVMNYQMCQPNSRGCYDDTTLWTCDEYGNVVIRNCSTGQICATTYTGKTVGGPVDCLAKEASNDYINNANMTNNILIGLGVVAIVVIAFAVGKAFGKQGKRKK